MFRIGAKVISFVFHPLLLATYMAIVIGVFRPSGVGPQFSDPKALSFTTSLIFVTTFLIPALSVGILLSLRPFFGKKKEEGALDDTVGRKKNEWSNFFSQLTMKKREDRLLPFAFISAFYMLTTYMFQSKGFFEPKVIVVLMAVSGLIILLTFITYFWQISVHSAGVAGLAGILGFLSFQDLTGSLIWPTAVCIFLAGIVMSARLYLNCHTPAQVYAGGLLGFMATYLPLALLFG
ncbi:hypothetical protein FUAX_01040 [Fulvitalea axinellae]|uniref:PAP2 superfamily protein n=1 Tax=Fulvitalea axinellae TaxID=1182444 RepID=A0AAU9CQN1_9BACT|nr:hypothetical protein FUAX_01040 [Fulvitalea axinellae]